MPDNLEDQSDPSSADMDEQYDANDVDESEMDEMDDAEEIEEIEEAEETEEIESAAPSEAFITWEAKEYISGEKSPIWYIGFFIVVLALILLDFLFLKAYTFTAVIVVSVIALFIYFRTARIVTYSLDNKGLHIDAKLYKYSDFRSFGILDDGKTFSIVLIPKKRFSPSVSMLFPEDLGESIVDIFGQRIPMEEVKLDLIDRLIKRLRI